MKLTRKSYNRRVFTFGALVFLSIALISTGFATWVMSTNASAGNNGGVTVDTITEGSLEFKGGITFVDEKDFRFNPDAADTKGEIKASADIKEESNNDENLSVAIKFEILPKQYLDYLSIQMTSIPAGIRKAAEQKYIVLPECVEEIKIYPDNQYPEGLSAPSNVVVQDNEGQTGYIVTYTINFSWGEFFDKDCVEDIDASDNLNPGYFLDGEKNSKATYSYNEKKEIMTDLRATIYGLEKQVTGVDEERTVKYVYTNPETNATTDYTIDQMLGYTPEKALSYGVTVYAYSK